MQFTFASRRQISFIITTGGRNLLVSFGARNQAGVSVFMTSDAKVAQAIRRHSLTRRGIIEETTVQMPDEEKPVRPDEEPSGTEPRPTGTEPRPDEEPSGTEPKAAGGTSGSEQEREYDNYTVARESICKEFGIKKELVRNPTALARVAKEHGVIIKYKER